MRLLRPLALVVNAGQILHTERQGLLLQLAWRQHQRAAAITSLILSVCLHSSSRILQGGAQLQGPTCVHHGDSAGRHAYCGAGVLHWSFVPKQRDVSNNMSYERKKL